MSERCPKCGTPKEYSGLPDSAGWCPLSINDCRIKSLEERLAEADHALIEFFNAWIADDPFISDAATRAYNKAKDREASRKKGAEHGEE